VVSYIGAAREVVHRGGDNMKTLLAIAAVLTLMSCADWPGIAADRGKPTRPKATYQAERPPPTEHELQVWKDVRAMLDGIARARGLALLARVREHDQD
jgi:hypothetical protein